MKPLLGLAALLATGCILLTAEQLQRIRLFLETAEELPAGELTEVHSTVYPRELTVRGNLVKLFGKITPPEGGELPASVSVQVVSADIPTEQVYNRVRFTLRIGEDGSFAAFKRLRRDFTADTLQQILVRPNGGPVPSGTRLALCIEVVKRRGDASATESCQPTPAGDGEGSVVEVAVLDNQFEPRSITIQPGDTVRWILRGEARNHTTTARDGAWDSGLAFQVAGATFERLFPAVENGRTFEYACTTHQTCCAMQGSVRVGDSAPSPDDGY